MLAYGFMNVKPVMCCYAQKQVIVAFFVLMPLWRARLGSKAAKIAVATKVATFPIISANARQAIEISPLLNTGKSLCN